jgi:RNA polymerase-binding transcription factor DksA
MALDIKQAKRIEARVHTRNRNGKNTLESVKIYIFDCCGDCGGEIRPTKQTLNTHSGYCVRCVKRKPENKYRTIYNRLLYNAKREGWQCDV